MFGAHTTLSASFGIEGMVQQERAGGHGSGGEANGFEQEQLPEQQLLVSIRCLALAPVKGAVATQIVLSAAATGVPRLYPNGSCSLEEADDSWEEIGRTELTQDTSTPSFSCLFPIPQHLSASELRFEVNGVSSSDISGGSTGVTAVKKKGESSDKKKKGASNDLPVLADRKSDKKASKKEAKELSPEPKSGELIGVSFLSAADLFSPRHRVGRALTLDLKSEAQSATGSPSQNDFQYVAAAVAAQIPLEHADMNNTPVSRTQCVGRLLLRIERECAVPMPSYKGCHVQRSFLCHSASLVPVPILRKYSAAPKAARKARPAKGGSKSTLNGSKSKHGTPSPPTSSRLRGCGSGYGSSYAGGGDDHDDDEGGEEEGVLAEDEVRAVGEAGPQPARILAVEDLVESTHTWAIPQQLLALMHVQLKEELREAEDELENKASVTGAATDASADRAGMESSANSPPVLPIIRPKLQRSNSHPLPEDAMGGAEGDFAADFRSEPMRPQSEMLPGQQPLSRKRTNSASDVGIFDQLLRYVRDEENEEQLQIWRQKRVAKLRERLREMGAALQLYSQDPHERGYTFKSSKEKKNPELSFIATNLHVQAMTVLPAVPLSSRDMAQVTEGKAASSRGRSGSRGRGSSGDNSREGASSGGGTNGKSTSNTGSGSSANTYGNTVSSATDTTSMSSDLYFMAMALHAGQHTSVSPQNRSRPLSTTSLSSTSSTSSLQLLSQPVRPPQKACKTIQESEWQIAQQTAEFLSAHAYGTVTVGAFAAHACGFKRGGIMQIRREVERMEQESKQMFRRQRSVLTTQSAERNIEDLRWELKRRTQIAFSQALTTLVTTLDLKLHLGLAEAGGGGVEMLRQLARLGFLFSVESLISSYGKEAGMLGDMEAAMAELASVTIRIVLLVPPPMPVTAHRGRKPPLKHVAASMSSGRPGGSLLDPKPVPVRVKRRQASAPLQQPWPGEMVEGHTSETSSGRSSGGGGGYSSDTTHPVSTSAERQQADGDKASDGRTRQDNARNKVAPDHAKNAYNHGVRPGGHQMMTKVSLEDGRIVLRVPVYVVDTASDDGSAESSSPAPSTEKQRSAPTASPTGPFSFSIAPGGVVGPVGGKAERENELHESLLPEASDVKFEDKEGGSLRKTRSSSSLTGSSGRRGLGWAMSSMGSRPKSSPRTPVRQVPAVHTRRTGSGLGAGSASKGRKGSGPSTDRAGGGSRSRRQLDRAVDPRAPPSLQRPWQQRGRVPVLRLEGGVGAIPEEIRRGCQDICITPVLFTQGKVIMYFGRLVTRTVRMVHCTRFY
jgi:hypothetical protein